MSESRFPAIPSTFPSLVESRRQWISDVLIPWCRSTNRVALRQAELEWQDIAGRVSPEKSLWVWAWERFPDLVLPELRGLDESGAVRVELIDGRQVTGYPDARLSEQGELYLVSRDQGTQRVVTIGPISIDEIRTASRLVPRPLAPPPREITPGLSDEISDDRI